MTDYISKIISIFLIFIMLIITPLMFSYQSNASITKRMLLNETSMFLDKVTDKGSITQSDIDEFNLIINSYGLVMNATIQVLINASEKAPDGDIHTIYLPNTTEITKDTKININNGNIVKVTLNEITTSKASRILYSFVRVIDNKFNFSLAKMCN